LKNSFYIKQTHSTNALLWEMIREKQLPEGFVVFTDFQTAGKGQPGNSWESEDAKNLLFSIVLHPLHVPMDELFLLSQLVSIAIKKMLDQYVDNITVKWPNDIYWKDKKLAGILIENSLQGNKIKTVVIGVGLNVNQKDFISDAPNPVSLLQIKGKILDRKLLLNKICENILDLYKELNVIRIRFAYSEALYRNEDYHTFNADNESFQAKIIEVHPDGKLELETLNGERKGYYFKEVSFVI
jgi:BirA family biotin operon repressor/biotin-[acetyl-CoA-carboxylase] ligase